LEEKPCRAGTQASAEGVLSRLLLVPQELRRYFVELALRLPRRGARLLLYLSSS
jgi:hypothetical protein